MTKHHHHNGHHHAHHAHHHGHDHHHRGQKNTKILTVRANSGLSGDMILTGLLCMNKNTKKDIDELLKSLNMPELEDCLSHGPHSVNHIGGWKCTIKLPHQHCHRSLADIKEIIKKTSMSDEAKELSTKTFTLLARAEGKVHGIEPEKVHFHEVGALDSILDICLACALFAKLSPSSFVCSPLPLGDGAIECAHGTIPAPAPAVLELLEGIPVCGFSGEGETVTPTAIALLRSLGAEFGPWPSMIVKERAIAYGGRVFKNAPNGAIWALGSGYEE